MQNTNLPHYCGGYPQNLIDIVNESQNTLEVNDFLASKLSLFLHNAYFTSETTNSMEKDILILLLKLWNSVRDTNPWNNKKLISSNESKDKKLMAITYMLKLCLIISDVGADANVENRIVQVPVHGYDLSFHHDKFEVNPCNCKMYHGKLIHW